MGPSVARAMGLACETSRMTTSCRGFPTPQASHRRSIRSLGLGLGLDLGVGPTSTSALGASRLSPHASWLSAPHTHTHTHTTVGPQEVHSAPQALRLAIGRQPAEERAG